MDYHDACRLDRFLETLPAADALWLSGLLEPPWKQGSRRRELRNALIRNAWALTGAPNPTAAAVKLATELRRYLASPSWAADRAKDCPPDNASLLRKALFGIALANNGKSMGWRSMCPDRCGSAEADYVKNN